MSFKHLIAGTSTLLAASFAAAAPIDLGTSVALPLVEGGVLTVAVVAMVAGVRIVRARRAAKPAR